MVTTIYLNDEKVLNIVPGAALTVEMRMLDSIGIPLDLTDATDLRLELPAENRTLKCFGTSQTFLGAAVDVEEDTISLANHGLAPNQIVRLSGSDLPAGLAAATDYFVLVVDEDTLSLAASEDGDAIDITDIGSGTHTLVYAPLSLPGDNDELLGKITVVLSSALTAALKVGEKQTLEFHYTKATGEKQIVQALKALTVVAQAL
jgi:hypothetical protein